MSTAQLTDPDAEHCFFCKSDKILTKYDEYQLLKSFYCKNCGFFFERDRADPYSIPFMSREERSTGKYCEIAAQKYKQPGGQCISEECIHYDELIFTSPITKGCTKLKFEACPLPRSI